MNNLGGLGVTSKHITFSLHSTVFLYMHVGHGTTFESKYREWLVSLHASRTGAEGDIHGAVRPLGVPALVGRDGGALWICGACLLPDGQSLPRHHPDPGREFEPGDAMAG